MTQQDIQLIEPTKELKDAYMDFIETCAKAGEPELPGSSWHCGDDFESFLRRVRDYAQGINIPEGWVPDSTFWLVQGQYILGVCDIRHHLTNALQDFGGHIGYSVRPGERNKGYGTLMLKLAKEKARQLGLDRMRITCAKTNIASQRVIQKNGGVLESESYSEKGGRITQRYWITISES